jgi:hypothetical protein
MNELETNTRKATTDERGFASIIRSTRAFRKELLQLDPWIPFPQNSCCFEFGPHHRPLPIGALFILWDEWPACTGTCRHCQGFAVGCGFGGLFHIGGVSGCCSVCGAGWSRHMDGLVAIGHAVEPYLKSTPYYVSQWWFGTTAGGPRAPLFNALTRLGATDLPDANWVKGSEAPAVSLTANPKEITEAFADYDAKVARGTTPGPNFQRLSRLRGDTSDGEDNTLPFEHHTPGKICTCGACRTLGEMLCVPCGETRTEHDMAIARAVSDLAGLLGALKREREEAICAVVELADRHDNANIQATSDSTQRVIAVARAAREAAN